MENKTLRKMIYPIVTEAVEKLPFYVTNIGSLENQHNVLRTGGHPNYHFLYCTGGKGQLTVNGRTYAIGENMGFFFLPGMPHEYHAEEEPWTTWWITFDGDAVKSMLPFTVLDKHEVFYVTETERLHQLHGDIHSAVRPALPSSNYDASHLLYRFLLELKNCISAEALKGKHVRSRQLHALLLYIEENYAKSITLDDMAKIAGVTPQHLCRIFRQTFNIRPFEYLTRCRLQKAKEALVGRGNPVLKEIAAETGFNDTSYFCSVFRHVEGMTPIEFKRMYKE